jgi:hypothetical protein
MSQSRDQTLREHTRTIITELTNDEQRLLSGVIKAEREKLHLKLPRNIKEDLWTVVVEVIK